MCRHFALGCVLGVLVLAAQVGPARAYACTSDADCGYEGCNDRSCSGYEHLSVCNNGVWDAFCYPPDNGHCHGHNGQAMGPYDRCPEPPTTSADPTTVEWAGLFATPQDSYTWVAQAAGGEYAAPGMKMVVMPADAATEAELLARKDAAERKFSHSRAEGGFGQCTRVAPGGAVAPTSDACYDLRFHKGTLDSTFSITTAGLAHVAIITSHLPTEFEDNEHYFKDAAGNDVDPLHSVEEEGPTPTTTGCEPVEKIIYESWQEDPGRKDWGRPGHSHCVQPYTWDELVDGYKDKYIPYKVGGLGKLLEPGGHETWVCLLDDHPCGDPHYCWVYHETDKVFTAWGTNTELGLHFKYFLTDTESGFGSGGS